MISSIYKTLLNKFSVDRFLDYFKKITLNFLSLNLTRAV
jgi:hypothetical protein